MFQGILLLIIIIIIQDLYSAVKFEDTEALLFSLPCFMQCVNHTEGGFDGFDLTPSSISHQLEPGNTA